MTTLPGSDADGTVRNYQGILLDIEDQKEIQDKYKLSKNRFRDISQNVPGAILQYTIRSEGSDSVQFMSPGCFGI